MKSEKQNTLNINMYPEKTVIFMYFAILHISPRNYHYRHRLNCFSVAHHFSRDHFSKVARGFACMKALRDRFSFSIVGISTQIAMLPLTKSTSTRTNKTESLFYAVHIGSHEYGKRMQKHMAFKYRE